MRELKDKERKILRVILFVSVVASVIIGLNGVFIDLYNPGSLEARQYSDIVNYIFVFTIIISVPLLVEKYQRFKKWTNKYESSDEQEKMDLLMEVIKPIAFKIIAVAVLALLASFVIAWYWQIPPEVVANYQNYYSGGIRTFDMDTLKSIAENINNSKVNNMTVNITNP